MTWLVDTTGQKSPGIILNLYCRKEIIPIIRLANNLAELSKPETRQVLQQEIFPQRTTDFGQGLLTTFDLAFYPKEKGPYNFEYTAGQN